MNKIKLTIIVPVYNAEKYLRQCLDSIVTQTLKEIEIICVNDGSTDLSLEILEEYQKKDLRIHVISKINDGLGAARNTGIAAAQGDYIGFVDSDDFIENDMFQKLYDKAIKADADVAIGNIKLFHDNTKTYEVYRNEKVYSAIGRLNAFSAKGVPWIVENIGVWDRIYRREFIESYNLRNPEHIIYEDALFSFQTSILANRIVVVNDAFYIYRKNIGTAITDKEVANDNYKFDFLKNCQAIRDFLIQQNVYPQFQKNYLNYFFKNALWHQSNISDYTVFKIFYSKARALCPPSDLLCIWHYKEASWKTRLYVLLILIDYVPLCYSIFFYKRKKLRS